MGYADLACYGGEIATPTLDRLGLAGARLSHFAVLEEDRRGRSRLRRPPSLGRDPPPR